MSDETDYDYIINDDYLVNDEFLDVGNNMPTSENHGPFVDNIDDGNGTVSDIDYFGEGEE